MGLIQNRYYGRPISGNAPLRPIPIKPDPIYLLLLIALIGPSNPLAPSSPAAVPPTCRLARPAPRRIPKL